MEPRQALQACIEMCGSLKGLADELEVTPSAICYWRNSQIPKDRVNQLVELSGHRLKETDFRPDLNWKFIKKWSEAHES